LQERYASYGSPVCTHIHSGCLRLAMKDPARIAALIVQNGDI
jgi:hypothetical protein